MLTENVVVFLVEVAIGLVALIIWDRTNFKNYFLSLAYSDSSAIWGITWGVTLFLLLVIGAFTFILAAIALIVMVTSIGQGKSLFALIMLIIIVYGTLGFYHQTNRIFKKAFVARIRKLCANI